MKILWRNTRRGQKHATGESSSENRSDRTDPKNRDRPVRFLGTSRGTTLTLRPPWTTTVPSLDAKGGRKRKEREHLLLASFLATYSEKPGP